MRNMVKNKIAVVVRSKADTHLDPEKIKNIAFSSMLSLGKKSYNVLLDKLADDKVYELHKFPY